MLVLLRARIANFEVWGLPLLIKQTRDKERMVVLAALEILDEACHDRVRICLFRWRLFRFEIKLLCSLIHWFSQTYLEELVSLWPDFTPHGDPGRLLMTRYYSLPRGLNHTRARIQHEIEHWQNGYNKRYVLLIEADTHANLTLHTKSEDGAYSRRSCSARVTSSPPNMLPHLYGQLVQTTQVNVQFNKFGRVTFVIGLFSRDWKTFWSSVIYNDCSKYCRTPNVMTKPKVYYWNRPCGPWATCRRAKKASNCLAIRRVMHTRRLFIWRSIAKCIRYGRPHCTYSDWLAVRRAVQMFYLNSVAYDDGAIHWQYYYWRVFFLSFQRTQIGFACATIVILCGQCAKRKIGYRSI